MKKHRKPPMVKVQAALTRPAEQERWRELRELHGSDLGVLRWLLGSMQEDERPDLPLVLGWSEIRIAQARMECMECDVAIELGHPYRRADTDKPDNYYAHTGCVE